MDWNWVSFIVGVMVGAGGLAGLVAFVIFSLSKE